MRLTLSLLFLLSCTTTPRSVRELYPKTKPKESGIVLSALKASGLPPERQGQTDSYRAHQVSCLRDLALELWRCGFVNAGRTYEIPSIESATLSGVLMNLPVPQGDSGVATNFIECRTFDGDPENASCDIAISLDYPGP